MSSVCDWSKTVQKQISLLQKKSSFICKQFQFILVYKRNFLIHLIPLNLKQINKTLIKIVQTQVISLAKTFDLQYPIVVNCTINKPVTNEAPLHYSSRKTNCEWKQELKQKRHTWDRVGEKSCCERIEAIVRRGKELSEGERRDRR